MKAIDVARYFITLDDEQCQKSGEEGACLSKLKIQKLLYYAQGYYSALYDKPLFEEEIQAWEHGPVVVAVYDHFKGIDGNFIPASNKMSEEEIRSIGEKERELIEDVFLLMGQYSAWKLRNKTHTEDPWMDTYKDGVKNIVIPLDTIKKYFKQYVEK